MALPLHSILLPRRFIHVDDKKNILLAGCGPYIDRFDLSPSPVLRSRLGVFTGYGEDVQGIVGVKDTPYFVAFSPTRLALLHEDNLKQGGIVAHFGISEPLIGIREVLGAEFVKGELLLLLETTSSLEVRKIVSVPSSFFACFLVLLVSASSNGFATAFATLRSNGSIIFSVFGENTVTRMPIPRSRDDKAMLMANLGDNKFIVVSSKHRRSILSLTIENGELSCETEVLPCPTEQRKGVLPLLVALSEDRRHVAIANSDKTIDYSLLDSEGKRCMNGKKEFFAPSTITSLAIVGSGKTTTIYYGTVTGEVACFPVSFYYDDHSSRMIAGSEWEEAVESVGQVTRVDGRSKGVVDYGLVAPFNWLASDGSLSHSYGIMAAFSSKHLLISSANLGKKVVFNGVSLVAVAMYKHYLCMQSGDGIVVVFDMLASSSTRYNTNCVLSKDEAKLGKTPLVKHIVVREPRLSESREFVVVFDNGRMGYLSGANESTYVEGNELDSLFSSGDAGSVEIWCNVGSVVRAGRLGHIDNVYVLLAKGALVRLHDKTISGIWLAETVAVERVLSLTPLPDGDLLVCGIRKGVLVGVSLSSLRLLFSLSHRRDLFSPSISQCTVLLEDDTFRITAMNGQTLVEAVEPFYGGKTLIVEGSLHSEKIVAQTSVYIGYGDDEKKASYESHAIITASLDGHVVISSLLSNGRLVPLHRFRAPGVKFISAFSYASQRCAPCVKAVSKCIHRKAATKTFRWVVIVAGTSNDRQYYLSFDAASLRDPRVVDRPTAELFGMSGAHSSVHIAARPSLHGLVQATFFFMSGQTTVGAIEVSAVQKAKRLDDVHELTEEEKTLFGVSSGLVATTLNEESFHSLPLLHSSALLLQGFHPAIVHNRFVYTSGSLRPREGALIGTKDGHIFLWGIVEEGSTYGKRRKTVPVARRGDPTRLPSEYGMVEEKKTKWGVIAHWTPFKKIGKVVALSSTLSPSSAATTIAAVFSTGEVGIFLLALDKLVFVQWLESEIKDPVGISVSLQGTDNLNSRCASPYPSSAVVSGGNSIEVVRICKCKLKKAIEKVWESA